MKRLSRPLHHDSVEYKERPPLRGRPRGIVYEPRSGVTRKRKGKGRDTRGAWGGKSRPIIHRSHAAVPITRYAAAMAPSFAT